MYSICKLASHYSINRLSERNRQGCCACCHTQTLLSLGFAPQIIDFLAIHVEKYVGYQWSAKSGFVFTNMSGPLRRMNNLIKRASPHPSTPTKCTSVSSLEAGRETPPFADIITTRGNINEKMCCRGCAVVQVPANARGHISLLNKTPRSMKLIWRISVFNWME